MLELSTAFQADRFKEGGKLDTIITFVDQDLTPWMFSTAPVIIDMEAANLMWTPIPLIQRTSGISEGFDPITRKWQVGDVKITLSNLPFQRDDGGSDMLRASDLLTNIVGCDITIYLIPSGLDTVLLSDLLIKFVGRIHGSCEYDTTKCVLTLKDKGAYINKSLPLTTLKADHPNAIDTTKSVPMVYGTFNQAYSTENTGAGNGLAHGWRTDRDIEPSYRFAVHALKSIDTPFVHVAPKVLAYPGNFIISKTRSAIEFRKQDEFGYVMLNAPFAANDEYPFTNANYYTDRGEEYFDTPSAGVTDKSSAYDGDPNTVAIITDNIRDDGAEPDANSRVGLGCWGVNSSSVLWQIIDNHDPEFTVIYLEYRYANPYFVPGGGQAPSIGEGAVCFGSYKEPPDGGAFKLIRGVWSTLNFLGGTDWEAMYSVDMPLRVFNGASILFQVSGGNRSPWGIYFLMLAQGTSGATGDDNMLGLGEIRIRAYFPETEFPDDGWLSCEGLVFGSWIDTAGRSNDYNIHDLIEDPAFIIESLLRDYLDLTDSDIDTDSFDAAADDSVVARLNIDKPTDSSKAIKQLSEQSTFCYVYSGAGKARLISLTNDVDPVATIPWSHIIHQSGAGIKVNRTDRLVNYLVVDSRWIPEFNEFTDQDIYQDVESQEKNKKGQTPVKWKNINDTTAEYIAAHYVQSPNHLWSRPHTVIEFETLGFYYANLELGDRIQLDSESIDSKMKLYGGTWYNHKFMVMGITQYTDKTKIVAIELIPGYPGQLVATARATAVDPSVIAANGNPIANTPLIATATATCISPTILAAEGPKVRTPEIALALAMAVSPTVLNYDDIVVTPLVATANATCYNPTVLVPQGTDNRLPVLAEAVGHWRFEGDLTDETSAGNDLTGSNIAGGDYVEGYTTPDINTALDLDYTSEDEYCYITAANDSDFNPGLRSFTIEAIFSTTDVTNTQVLIGKYGDWKVKMGFRLQIVNGRIIFHLGVGSMLSKVLNSTFNNFATGDWRYVAIVVDRTNHRMRFYVDGAHDSSQDVDISDWANRNVASPSFDQLNVGQINGLLDEVAVTMRALTSEEIFIRGFGLPIRHNWALDFTPSLGGAPFSYAKVLHDSGLNCLTGLTLEVWIKLDTGGGIIQTLVIKSYNTFMNMDYQLSLAISGGTARIILNNWTHGLWTDYRSDINNNQWNHIVGVMDGTNWTIYLNGSNIKTELESDLPSNNDDGDVYLGATPTGDAPPNEMEGPFSGYLDNVCIYNRGLTSDEVTAQYNSGNGICSPIKDGLMAYWRFDEGAGNMTYDAVGTNDAILLPSGDAPDWAIGKVQCKY